MKLHQAPRALFLLALLGAPLTLSCAAQAPAETVQQQVQKPKDIELAPMVWLSDEEREKLRQLVLRDAEAQALFAPVKARADEALEAVPSPVSEVIYEGRVEADRERGVTKKALFDMERLRDLLYAYSATGEAKYGDKAREFVLAWVRKTRATGNPINMNKLDAIPVAYGQLRESFSAEEQAQIERWLRELADATIRETRDNKGNWHSKRLKLVGAVGFLFADAKYIEWTTKGFGDYVRANVFPDGETHDLRQRDSMSYHASGVVPLLEIAIAARAMGTDLYSFATPDGASTQRAVDYTIPFATGEKIHAEWVDSKEPFDRKRWEAGDDKYKPGTPWNPKDGLKMFELAAFFDPQLRPIVGQLAGQTHPKYGTWLGVLSAASATK